MNGICKCCDANSFIIFFAYVTILHIIIIIINNNNNRLTPLAIRSWPTWLICVSTRPSRKWSLLLAIFLERLTHTHTLCPCPLSHSLTLLLLHTHYTHHTKCTKHMHYYYFLLYTLYTPIITHPSNTHPTYYTTTHSSLIHTHIHTTQVHGAWYAHHNIAWRSCSLRLRQVLLLLFHWRTLGPFLFFPFLSLYPSRDEDDGLHWD